MVEQEGNPTSKDLESRSRDFNGYASLVSKIFGGDAKTIEDLKQVANDSDRASSVMDTVDAMLTRRTLPKKPQYMQKLALTKREQEVIEMRFNLVNAFGTALTLNQTGKRMGVSGERIRQLEAKALRKLRHPSIAVEIFRVIKNNTFS